MTKLSLITILLSLFLTGCSVPTSKSSSQTPSSSVTVSTSSSDSASSKSDTSESSTTASDTDETIAVTPVDEVASIGNMRYLVSRQSHTKSLGNYQANGTYLVLIIGARNDSSKAVIVDTTAFKIIDNGDTYSASSFITLLVNQADDDASNHSFFLEQLNPNQSMAGYVIFDVPTEVASSDTKQLLITNTFGDYQSGLLNLE
jgi:hypothetical protein